MSRTGHSTRHEPGVHVVAHAPVRDGLPAFDGNFAGITVKQLAPKLGTARGDMDLIAASEKYYLLIDQSHDMAIPAGMTVAKGDELYIDKTSNALTKADLALNNGVLRNTHAKFGKVSYVGPESGLPTDLMTVNLDQAPRIAG